MPWNLSPLQAMLGAAVVAAIAGLLIASRISVVEGAVAFGAILVAGGLYALTVEPRQRSARREPILSVWDFVGVPFAFVAVTAIAYGVDVSSVAEAAGFGAVVAALDVFTDAQTRRRSATGGVSPRTAA